MDTSKKTIVVLSGAGVSAESGIKTFRDADGLWEGHDVMAVASMGGWMKNRKLVLNFYNERRRQLKEVEPNTAHHIIADLEKDYNVIVVTQNVDDLHERAGSTQVVHLHGELKKVRSVSNQKVVMDWTEDCNIGDLCPDGTQLRPHIVWFGEAVPMLQTAAEVVSIADIIIIVGTSLQVYPAAGLVGYALPGAKVYYVDPKPATNWELERTANLKIIKEKATVGMEEVAKELRKNDNPS